jgi:2-oxoacid:acceptor oxidoreductase delta subunit (pyruvate/2-ketoisovalerate family)
MSLPRATGMPTGGTVVRDEAVRNRTGGWRTGVKPRANLDLCVNCKLCWVYCPDSAVLVESGVFRGFDYDVCKGCEICAEMCPVDAIEMVLESESVPPRGLINGGSDA